LSILYRPGVFKLGPGHKGVLGVCRKYHRGKGAKHVQDKGLVTISICFQKTE